jgi:hypothetical protein
VDDDNCVIDPKSIVQVYRVVVVLVGVPVFVVLVGVVVKAT